MWEKSKSNKEGAEELLESIKVNLGGLNVLRIAKEKLTGGECANTGRKSGLWVGMMTYSVKDILCFWRIAHISDVV